METCSEGRSGFPRDFPRDEPGTEVVAAGSELLCSGEQRGKATELGETELWVMVIASQRASMPLRASSQALGKVK